MLSTRAARREHLLLELIGWFGVLCVIGAYLCITLNILDGQSTLYLVLNGTGAIGIMVHSFHRRDYQPLVLNTIWLLIALLGLIRSFDVVSATHLLGLVHLQGTV